MYRFLLLLLIVSTATTGWTDTTLVNIPDPADSTDVSSPGLMDATIAGDSIQPLSAPVIDSSEIKDTVLIEPMRNALIRSWELDSIDYERHLSQNPTVALVKSVLVPGLGQIGNRRYIKAAIFIGLESWLISKVLHHREEARDRWEAYSTASGEYKNYHYSLYRDSRTQRNKYAWYAGLTVFVSMFDAYVDAHLSGTPDRKRDHKIEIDIAPDTQGGANLKISLNL